ncbi:unnamed protein product [Schistosoma rodhaini]|nr:unnamed protein product [Schistosoma rodhaini]
MSASESTDENLQYTYHTKSETSVPKASGRSDTRNTPFEGPGVAGVIVGNEPVRRPALYKRPETNIPNICVEPSSQNFKSHLKKLHIAVNKILENDRLTKYRNPSKKNLKENQEACEKMLDAVRELGSFIVQRRNTSPISHRIRSTKEVQSRFSMRVRSKSTTHDDSISHKRNLTVKMGRSLKSVRRTTSLTKRSKSPIKRSFSPYPVFDTEYSCCSKKLENFKGVDTKYRFPVKSNTFIASNQETESVQASEDFTHSEIACLEAELSHRDSLIQYLSAELLKLHQDNDRIFNEYELQEANLTKYLHSLRSRLIETDHNLDQQQYNTTTNTTNTTNNPTTIIHSMNTDYITHINQSISETIHYNNTDSIIHHFAIDIHNKLIHPGNLNPIQKIQQSFLSELQELRIATENLLTYWEVKSQEVNYFTICQQFFNALLHFCMISMKQSSPIEESDPFKDPNLNDLQMKANHAEQQIIDLSNEIKNYQIELNQLNEKLKKTHIATTNNNENYPLLSNYFLSSTNSSSNIENINFIDNQFMETNQSQCILSLDKGSSSLEDPIRIPPPSFKSTTMQRDISTISIYNSINNVLQRLSVLLSKKESKLPSKDSTLCPVNKEDYDTLYEAYHIIEQFQWYIQNNIPSTSVKSSSVVESQSSLSTSAYYIPESINIEINRTNETDTSTSIEVPSITNSHNETITSFTDQSTTTAALTCNQHKIKDSQEIIKKVNVESFKVKESSYTKYTTKSIQLTDMYTSTSDLLTLFISKDHNDQLDMQQFKQMNDQSLSTDDLIQTTLLEKSALRELQGKFKCLKDSCTHLISQYQMFNQILCEQLNSVHSAFNEYKSNISFSISYQCKDVCDSFIQTDSFSNLHLLTTDTSHRQIPLDHGDLHEVEYYHSSWPTAEVIPSDTIISCQSVLSTDSCTSELSQLKQEYEILQSKLQKSEREVDVLRNSLSDIENHITLSITNHHFIKLQRILDGGGFPDVQSLTKAFLNQISTILSNLSQNIPDQDHHMKYESIDPYLTDEYDHQKHRLYSAEQSFIRLTELHDILQQQILKKQNTLVEPIEQDTYPFNREIDRLLQDEKCEITDLELTEKLQSALNVIYEELSSCQQLVEKLLSEKTEHCKLIAMQASQIEELTKKLIDYDCKLKAYSREHNIVRHNQEMYNSSWYENNEEKMKNEYHIYHHDSNINAFMDSSTKEIKSKIYEQKLINKTITEHTTMVLTEQREYERTTNNKEIKPTSSTETLLTSGFTYPSTVDQSTMSAVEMTREKLVSSSLCEDKSNVVSQLREELASCYEQIVKLSKSVEESDASLMDVRRLLTVKESEVADLREEKRHLRDEVNELRETVEAERRDLDIMRANVDVLERKEEVSAMHFSSRLEVGGISLNSPDNRCEFKESDLVSPTETLLSEIQVACESDLTSCSLCKLQNVSDPCFICNLCVRCITSIQNPDVYNFMLNDAYPEINPMNGSTDDVVDDEDVNSPCDLISDHTPYTDHSQLVTQQSLPIDTQHSELEHKLIIAKSEMNRLYDLLYNIRSNNHNEQERDQDQLLSISTINLNLQRFIDGLFKEILQSLNESTSSSSSSSSISCLTDCIQKYVMLNNELITFPKNQYTTNYYKHLNQFMNLSHLNHKPIIDNNNNNNNNQFKDSQIEIQKIYFENLYLKKQNDQIFNDMNQQFSMIKLLINKSISNQILNTFFEKSITNSFIMNHHFNQYYKFIDYLLNERNQLINENLYYKNYINNNNESHLIDIENIDNNDNNNDKDDLDHFVKQQLDQFNHSILKTNHYLLNKINKINLKIDNIENQLNNNQKYFNQKLINLQKINNQWKNNINLMFNHLFNLIHKINSHDDDDITTTTTMTAETMTAAAASTTVTTDQIQTHDFNITEQSLSNVTATTMTTATTTTVRSTTTPATDIPLSTYHLNESPINILSPNDIMPSFDLLMNQLQPQLNKMGMIENQLNSYNILIKQLIKQSNKLNNEINQLQSLINNQNNETMIIDHLVTDNVAIATEPIEENDHDDNVTIATEPTEVDNHDDDDNTNIEMIMEKMKTYTSQLNCIRKKLIQIKQEKSNLLYHQMNEKPLELLNIEQMETHNEDTTHVDYELVVEEEEQKQVEEEEDIHRCHQSTSLNKKIDHVECINEQCHQQLSTIKEDISTIKTMILHIKEYMNRNLQHTFIYTSMDLHQALELDKSDDLLCNKLKMFSKFTHNLYELLQLYTVLSVPEVSSVEVCSEDDIVTFLDTLLSSIKNILERNDTKNSNIPIIDSTHQCIDSLEQQTTNQRTDEMISSLNEIPITTEVQLIRDQLQSHDPEVRIVEETINVTEQSLLNVRRDCTEFKDDERSVGNSTPDDSDVLHRSNNKLLCRSFSLLNLSQFNDKSMKLDSPLALNGISLKRLFKSMVAISSQTSTYPLSIMYLLRPPYLTFVLESLQKLEVSTPAILLNLQQQLRILLLLTPENHLACLEHVHKYLTDIDTYLLVKELITRKSLNDLRFELLKLTRLKHIERKKRMDNITMNTSSTLSSSSFISLDLQTLLPEDVLDKKILHIKEKLNQTILSYKCIQELLNHKDDFTLNITGDVDLVGSDTTTTTGSDTFLCYRSSDHDPQFYISHDKEQSQITISKNNEDPVFIADHSELDYALRLLHLRDTELLYIISTQNKSEEESTYNVKYNLSASILTSEVLKEKLKKFLYWENIDPININSIPIHRININMLELQESSEQQQQIDTISSVSKNQLFINIETTEITDQSTTGQMSYHEDMDWYEQHLYTLVQNALNALNQMNQHFLESKKPLLSECRQEEFINILTKLLTTIPINSGIQQDPHEKTVPKIFPSSSFSFSPSLTSSSLLEEHQRCNTTATTMTPSGITLSSTTPTYNTTTTATSFSQAKPISEISDSSNLSLTTNLTYPRRSEKTSIHELISSVDHLKNLKELRNLAKYLLDQYHIVTSELELQSDTNWCLRQRLTNANSQLNRLTGLLNKGSQGLSSIEEDLSLGTDKTSLRSEHYDGIRQRSLQPTYYNLNTLQEKHTTSGRRLNFIPSSNEHLVIFRKGT